MASNGPRWQNTSLPAHERVEALIAEMTLREKVAQLYGVWVASSPVGDDVAPFQHDMNEDAVELDELLPHGLGQLTRSFGSAPVDAAVGVVSLARSQRRIMAANRFGIPAIAHEECLAGFTAWGATAYPVPLSWGATFDPALIERVAQRIGAGMRAVGVHQGLAPVLDVTRDPRWGRTEETIGEDPYLVGTIATAYVRGLESTGIVATLKHFIGYSASKAARNLAPVSMGRREFNDVMVPPFELAVRDGGVRSVMHAYTDVDGVPSAGDETLLTGLLRDTWGFTGTVVADYFGIAFLKTLHGVAGTWEEAAAAALKAGVDVELPTVKAYGDPLVAAVESGELAESFVDRALRRVLLQKAEFGMLDAGWSPLPDGWTDADLDDIEAVRGRVRLDTDDDRALAREVAERAVVLVRNDGTLPLTPDAGIRIAVIGPLADDQFAMLGCYSFPSHVGTLHPEVPIGIELPTVLESLRAEFANARFTVEKGVSVDGKGDGTAEADAAGIERAMAAAEDADLVIAVLGDHAGLFGRGTSGEGCDAASMRLPGRQQDLLDALIASGTPVVATLVEGRPYSLGTAADEAAAIVTAFFPGEEGGPAIAGVLSGRVNPSGRLPVSIPAIEGGQPGTYLAAPLGGPTGVSNIDPTAKFPFGHGLSYTTFEWSDAAVDAAQTPTSGAVTVSLTVTNIGERDGIENVQLYLHDPVASVVRPVNRLIGYASVPLEAGTSARVSFRVSADLAAFTGRDFTRIVEPGELELRLGASSGDLRFALPVTLTGPVRHVDHTRTLHAPVTVA
ncbi:glycoside hydrolase family 3 N-terminal domain-containing protein [Humibacter ginsenosidimutans]|uniref:Glycosyl hydrolase n=1 Tax=Humibacter ginsenosidimutans TaxID=2599293 RepID=A0A5B8M7P7_9MICO|nr:glycoside hydrolase family 3 N-terminal domain-containing protein [Humibacter ginsenosidimutans]QDZ16241.1 glycosyl hydrolase [Humibacter ginsenosidimutans]